MRGREATVTGGRARPLRNMIAKARTIVETVAAVAGALAGVGRSARSDVRARILRRALHQRLRLQCQPDREGEASAGCLREGGRRDRAEEGKAKEAQLCHLQLLGISEGRCRRGEDSEQ